MKFDFRKKDVVQIRFPLTLEDKEKVYKFSRRISGQDMRDYTEGLLRGNRSQKTFKVKEFKKTVKTKTEYSVLITSDDVLLPIQARYLKLFERKARHPLTNIFQD